MPILNAVKQLYGSLFIKSMKDSPAIKRVSKTQGLFSMQWDVLEAVCLVQQYFFL